MDRKLPVSFCPILLCFLFSHHKCQSQSRFYTYAGIGFGAHFEEQFPYNDQPSNGRLAIYLSPYVRLSDKVSTGLSAMVSGRMTALLGGAPPLDYYDAASHTTLINYNNLSASTFLAKVRYDWMKKDAWTIYCDLGLGMSRYTYVHVAQSAFSIAPEVGITIDSFQFAATFIGGGQTPSFSTGSAGPGSTVLTSIRSNRFYITLSYRLFQF